MHVALTLLLLVMAFIVGSQPVHLLRVALARWEGAGHFHYVAKREIALRSIALVGSILGLWLLWDSAVAGNDNFMPDWINSILLAILVAIIIGAGGLFGLFLTMNGEELRKALRNLT